MIKLSNNEEKTKSDSDSKSDSKNANKFAGMVVVFTGIRDSTLEQLITDGGGVIGSGVTGKTTLVVAKDITENTGKIKTAREKGIQLMNIEDFNKFIKSKF